MEEDMTMTSYLKFIPKLLVLVLASTISLSHLAQAQDANTPFVFKESPGKIVTPLVFPHAANQILEQGSLLIEFKHSDLNTIQGLFSKDATGRGLGGHFSVYIDAGFIRVQLSTDASTSSLAADGIAIDQTNQVMVTFGPEGFHLYINGILKTSRTTFLTGLQGNEEPIVVGALQTTSVAETAAPLRSPYKGSISKIALYSVQLNAADLLPNLIARPKYNAPAQKPTDANLIKARTLHQRLAGVALPMDSTTIQAIAADIEAGNKMTAAQKVTEDPDFYNITIRNLAAKMTNKDSNPKEVALDDLIATFMGIAYNDQDARLLLSGNFLYQGDSAKIEGLPAGVDSVLKSNAHYEHIVDTPQISMAEKLTMAPQMLVSSTGDMVANPESAGVLTSRSFGRAFLHAGTNRAAIQFSLRNFTCGDLAFAGAVMPLVNIRDGSLPDYRIGRDIDRAPAGEVTTFKGECRTCHAAMDGLRPAFGKWNYFALDDDNQDGFLKHTSLYSAAAANADETENNIKKGPNNIVAKMNHNSQVMPYGYEMKNTNFRNFYTPNPYFGFRGTADDSGHINGSGTKAYGEMLGNSKAFAQCLSKRAFREVCKRDVVLDELNTIASIGDDFEANGYKLKYLFQRIATLPNCVGL